MAPTKEQQIKAIQEEMVKIRKKIVDNADSAETREAFKQLEELAKRIAALKNS